MKDSGVNLDHGVEAGLAKPVSPAGVERPILFSAPMVCGILEGRKTQTRRLAKKMPTWVTGRNDSEVCPYGKPGDRLFVREKGWEPKCASLRELRDGADTWPKYVYDADGISKYEIEDFKRWGWKRRPSIHMPRRFSRITLEVTGVRVERLQEISEADARAEGIQVDECGQAIRPNGTVNWGSAVGAYAEVWNAINKKALWLSNPWVWVIEFTVLTGLTASTKPATSAPAEVYPSKERATRP